MQKSIVPPGLYALALFDGYADARDMVPATIGLDYGKVWSNGVQSAGLHRSTHNSACAAREKMRV
ncbi:MAG: hypothetical protein ABL897_05735 [Hyphomicrobium sp.]